jgi:hypothetical protein
VYPFKQNQAEKQRGRRRKKKENQEKKKKTPRETSLTPYNSQLTNKEEKKYHG